MAYLITPRIVYQRNNDIWPKMDEKSFNESQERTRKMKDEVLDTPSIVSPMYGIKFPLPEFTFKANANCEPEDLGHIFSANGWAISQTIVDIIEEIEPGVHQYFPIEFEFPSGRQLDERYFLLNICTMPQTLALDQCSGIFRHDIPNAKERGYLADFRLVFRRGMRRNLEPPVEYLKAYKDRVEGRAIWAEYGLTELMISDEFFVRVSAVESKEVFDITIYVEEV